MPDVVGKTQADATRLWRKHQASRSVTSHRPMTAKLAAGTVLKQVPAAGSDVDDGAAVALTVSSGPGKGPPYPTWSAWTRAAAEAALADAGFVPASVLQYDLAAPVGQVVDQLPAAGAQATAGTQVGLMVSRGRPEVSVSVPDVTGMTQDEATAGLAEARASSRCRSRPTLRTCPRAR